MPLFLVLLGVGALALLAKSAMGGPASVPTPDVTVLYNDSRASTSTEGATTALVPSYASGQSVPLRVGQVLKYLYPAAAQGSGLPGYYWAGGANDAPQTGNAGGPINVVDDGVLDPAGSGMMAVFFQAVAPGLSSIYAKSSQGDSNPSAPIYAIGIVVSS